MNQNNDFSSTAIDLAHADFLVDNLFEKRTIVELSDSELSEIQGGTTPACAIASIASFAALVGIGYAGYQVGQWLAS